MFRDTPIAIPLSFKNTRFPIVENKMRMLIRNREEALVAHELARNRMADWWRSHIYSVQTRRQGMARYKESEDEPPQED